jgi:2-oxoglutarate ferredoxin oxidoreductase subunit alpha
MERLSRKFDTARSLVPQPQMIRAAKPTRIGAIYYGSTSAAMDEARDLLAADGVHVDALRLRAFPFPPAVADFIEAHEEVFVVEQNRDGQLRTLLVNDLGVAPARLGAVLHFDGTPITARFIVREIRGRTRRANPQRVLEGVS